MSKYVKATCSKCRKQYETHILKGTCFRIINPLCPACGNPYLCIPPAQAQELIKEQVNEMDILIKQIKLDTLDETFPKLHEPKECPFCGSKLSGGGKHRAYYYCGSHIWIEQDKYGVWVLRGHPGICYDKENKNE